MKILIFCDSPVDVNYGGISQTLYNLFSNHEQSSLLCIAPLEEIKKYPPKVFKHISYKFGFFEIPQNRIGLIFGKFIITTNYIVNLFRSFSSLKKEISEFNPSLIIFCPNGPMSIYMYNKLFKDSQYKVFPYFMDDWMKDLNLSWLGGNLHSEIKKILKDNTEWLMIGDELSELIQKRYHLKPNDVLNIRNPVDINNAPARYSLKQKEPFTIAYAGALWTMHYDAFLIIAKAVNILKKDGMLIDLILYSQKNFWSEELESLNVIYGGLIPYHNIHKKLSEADLLLVTSSFLNKFYNHSSASLQTKLTDYLKAQRLIVSCGPEYSANNFFLKKNECGLCIESNDEKLAALELKNILNNIEIYNVLIENGWNKLVNEFSFEVVHEKLNSFLTNYYKL